MKEGLMMAEGNDSGGCVGLQTGELRACGIACLSGLHLKLARATKGETIFPQMTPITYGEG